MTIETESSNTPSAVDRHPVLAVVGVGLLGGSVALAAKERRIADRVIGIGRNPERLQAAVDAGVIDEFLTDLPDGNAPWTRRSGEDLQSTLSGEPFLALRSIFMFLRLQLKK